MWMASYLALQLLPAPTSESPDVATDASESPAAALRRADEESPPLPRKRGYGMLTVGAVLAGGFAPQLIGWSFALLADGRSCEQSRGSAECSFAYMGTAVMMPFGIAALAVGTPLIVVGARRLKQWRTWQRTHNVVLVPYIGGPTRGWTVGLDLRF